MAGAAQHQAKVVCTPCPVRVHCLAEALDHRIEFGVWGGMTERERRALLNRRPGSGQVWQYRPRGRSGGQLILFYESPGAAELDSPDNITVSPRGGIVLCEDGDDEQFLRGLTQRGQVFDFALNVHNDREWAGATFSPDGETLFVNIQGDTGSSGPGNLGRTFAIWGPWENGAL